MRIERSGDDSANRRHGRNVFSRSVVQESEVLNTLFCVHHSP